MIPYDPLQNPEQPDFNYQIQPSEGAGYYQNGNFTPIVRNYFKWLIQYYSWKFHYHQGMKGKHQHLYTGDKLGE